MFGVPKIKFSFSPDGKLKICLVDQQAWTRAKYKEYYVKKQQKAKGNDYQYNPRVPLTQDEKIERNKQSAKRYCEKIQKLNKLHKTLKRQGIKLV